jgi:hypothetical protein
MYLLGPLVVSAAAGGGVSVSSLPARGGVSSRPFGEITVRAPDGAQARNTVPSCEVNDKGYEGGSV